MNDSSFFPRSHRSSVSSATMSVDIQLPLDKHTQSTQPSSRTPPLSTKSSTASLKHKNPILDPLARDYPAPAQEATLDEMLARQPPKLSLAAYVKRPARDVPNHQADKDRAAAAFAAKKRELLESREKLRDLSFGK